MRTYKLELSFTSHICAPPLFSHQHLILGFSQSNPLLTLLGQSNRRQCRHVSSCFRGRTPVLTSFVFSFMVHPASRDAVVFFRFFDLMMNGLLGI